MSQKKKSKNTKEIKAITVSIDPGEKAAIAIYFDGELHSYEAVNGSDPKQIQKTMFALNRKLKEKHPAVDITAIIEDGFVGINPKASSTLSMRRGFFVYVCSTYGYTVEMRMPAYWQSRLSDFTAFDTTEPKLSTKDKSKIFVKNVLGIDEKDNNICDAIAMGYIFIHSDH